MIYVICRGLTTTARDAINRVFTSVGASKEEIQIVDLDFYEVDVTKMNFLFCTGSTIKDVGKELVKQGFYTHQDLLSLYRSDVVDRENGGFLLFSSFLLPSDWMTAARDEQFALAAKVKSFVASYKEVNQVTEEAPFQDRLPSFTTPEPPVREEAVEPVHTPEPEVIIKQSVSELDQGMVHGSVIEDVAETVVAIKQIVQKRELGWDLEQTISIDVGQYMNKLSELINLGDLVNSKTFASFPGFVLSTSGDDLHVFGTTSDLNRSPAKHKVLLKDLVSLVKCAQVFNAGKLTFYSSTKVEV